MGEDVNPEERAAEEAAPGAGQGGPGEPGEGETSIDFAEPTAADFIEAEAAAERARLAAQRMSWRRRTATGAILSGLALGFQQVFEDKKQDISVIVETSGEPPTDLPVEAELEGAPRRSVVKIRPWLLGEEGDSVLGTEAEKAENGEAGQPENGEAGERGAEESSSEGTATPRPEQ